MYLQLAENKQPQLAGIFSKLKKLSLKKITGGVVKAVKKVGLAVPRNAYLGIVALNVKGVATKLKRAIDKEPGKVKSKWESLGGNFGDFKKAVESGAKKKHLFEMDEEGQEYGHIVLSEGDVPGSMRVEELSTPAVPAAIAAAAPIIAALAPLVKQFTQKGDEPEGAQSIEDQAASIDPEAYKDPLNPANADMFDTEKGVNVQKSSGISTNTLLIGAAAVAAVYLLTRKQK